ncbi:MAG: HEPN domain-containing protein [bacterium]
MENHNKILAGDWFKKAQDDELSCEDILDDRRGAPSTVCFLSQQLAEKHLKGYLVYQGKQFPKIHQLDRLIKLCKETNATFEEVKEEAEYLTGFYVATRYPGDYPDFFWDDAEKAFESACRIKKFVLSKIDI